ncbi:MAG: Crp/Fnr family transcriptional regulator [Deltaproteobacteria bacterium]|nr:Crp/Fnr family transcriptional regulator [Deltaproteobacteria bacterium]
MAIESCLSCALKEDLLFCRLPTRAYHDLNAIRQTDYYPKGAVLFTEGELPRGLFVLCGGSAKLCVGSREGKNLNLRLVEPGEVLGLSSVVANIAHQTTAKTVTRSEISFFPRRHFLEFLGTHSVASIRVAEALSMELHKAWEQTRILTLAPSTRAKLAQWLLLVAKRRSEMTREGIRLPVNMTHQEIGDAIGASRETVSRLLADLKHEGVMVRLKGGSMLVLKPDKLREASET